MKTDRELLELAAKAAGIELLRWVDYPEGFKTTESQWEAWNPLTDDGDAFRLAFQLHLTVTFDAEATYAMQTGKRVGDVDGSLARCPRRAIVRAAAFIGEAMP